MSAVAGVRLASFDAERDEALLRRWLAQPHVARWWSPAEPIVAETRDPRLAQRLVLLDERPVGYLRWERVTAEALREATLPETLAGTPDLDLAIGEVEALGRGVGPACLALAFEEIWASTDAARLLLVTSVENTRAQRAFAKAGLRRELRFEDPESGPCWLLLLDRPGAPGPGAGAG